MNRKKLVSLCLVLALLVTAAVGATFAYFTDTDDATNTFTVGNVDIELTEPNWDGNGLKDAPEVYPNEALAKDPTVTNKGENPCFVRVSVTGWDSLIQAGLSKSNIIYRTNYENNKLGTGWVLHEDGYFYYNKPLAEGEATTKLFEQIVIPSDLVNGDASTPFNIEVKAFAVQAQGALNKNWAGVQDMTVAEIAQWFAQAAPADGNWVEFVNPYTPDVID